MADYDFQGVQGVPEVIAEAAPERSLTFGDLARRQMSGAWLVGGPERIVVPAAAQQGYDAPSVDEPGSTDSIAFERIDRDGDGYATREEVAQSPVDGLPEHFDRYDANHDGRLDESEYNSLLKH